LVSYSIVKILLLTPTRGVARVSQGRQKLVQITGFILQKIFNFRHYGSHRAV